MVQSQSAAVIDLGTNSIKFIYAEKTPLKTIRTLHEQTVEVRIGTGISERSPRLETSAIERVSNAIASLVQTKNNLSTKPIPIRMVATSAVREASNQNHLQEVIKAKTDIQLEILSGEREAYYIGQAIQLNPSYQKIGTLNSIDLGGGSLEWIYLKNNRVEKALSLPLGAVRLTEQFIQDPSQVISKESIRSIENHIKSNLTKNNIQLSPQCPLLGSGGAFHILTHILNSSHSLCHKDIEKLALDTASASMQERMDHWNIPEKRADIIPTALITIAYFMKHFKIEYIEHSKCSLKFGVLKEMLGI